MNHYTKFAGIKEFTDNIGSIYGTEDFAIYFYSIVKMTRPKTILELGTGLGTTTLWTALALQENNNQGQIYTVDDGSEWKSISQVKDRIGTHYREIYTEYIDHISKYFNLENNIKFFNQTIDKIDIHDIDILFCDYAHGPYAIVKLLADYIPRMNETSFIYVDSASTFYSSYHTLESIVSIFNQGKLPKTLIELVDDQDKDKFVQFVQNSKFELTHIVENKYRNQNSTAQIKIMPIDFMPTPRINIRF